MSTLDYTLSISGKAGRSSQGAVARIWAEVLGISEVDAAANFFDVGGDSMKVMDVIQRVGAELGVELPLMVFFEEPTVEHIAAFVDDAGRSSMSPTEESVAKIWADLLGLATVDPNANFFDVGGDSMRAMDLIQRIGAEFGVDLPLMVFFEEPTVVRIAAFIDDARRSSMSPTEESVAKIWADLLGLGAVDLNANFFDAGGDSMRAMDLIQRIGAEFGVELPLMVFFEEPTVVRIAAFLDAQSAAAGSRSVVQGQESRRAFPLAYAQELFWLLEQQHPGIYNTARIFELRGNVDAERLEAALNKLVRRHDILRVRFAVEDGRPVQIVEPSFTLTLQRGGDVLATVREPLALDKGEVLRARLIERGPAEYLLCIAIHHAVSDGFTGSILLDELVALYDGTALPEPETHFTEFAAEQRERMEGERLAREIAYWKQALEGAPGWTRLPSDFGMPTHFDRQGALRSVTLPKELLERVKAFAQANRTTLFTVLTAAFRILLYRWSGQTDFLIGTIASNRSRSGTERMMGCFVNPLPLRNRVVEGESVLGLLKRETASVMEAFAHQDCPFAKIVEAVNPERTGRDNPLFNVAFLLQNFPAIEAVGREFRAKHVSFDAQQALLDLRFIASETREGLQIDCEYSTGLFESSTIESLFESYAGILEQAVAAPDTAVGQISTKHVARKLVVAANFTAEPVEEALAFWMAQLRIPARIEFAGFDQVLQELLDPGSLVGRNGDGFNLILWQARSGQARELACALRTAAARRGGPIVVLVCPPEVPEEDAVLREELAGCAGVHVVFAQQILDLYPVANWRDEYAEALGAIPYTQEFYVALASMAARRIHALERAPYKVIALDCDNTLWKGVCGEDGPLGVTVDAPRRALQEFMLAQREAGMLLCLCSKNVEADVAAVFEQNTAMLLGREHIVRSRVNWAAKSGNLKELATELGLGLDSFILVDDNPVECAEVRANCPGTLALELPAEAEAIPAFLKQVWAFDHWTVTAEDRKRSELYAQQLEREQARTQAGTLEEFLDSLQLAVDIRPMAADDLARVSQLTQRTNQFNTTTVRRSEAEIADLVAGGQECLVVRVRDRFGDYGLVGAVLFGCSEVLTVHSFMLSCRVLGRGVEHRVLARVGEIARERGLERVDILFAATAKNRPALDFLESVGAEYRNGGVYALPVSVALQASLSARAAGGVENVERAPASAERTGTRVDLGRIAREFGSVADVLRACSRRSDTATSTDKARNAVEEVVAGIWSSVLRIDQPGINDNFFVLGGNSLLGVQVISRVRQMLGVELPLRALFEHATLGAFARRVGSGRAVGADKIGKTVNTNLCATSFAQQRLWFIDQLEPGNAIYNIPQMTRIRGALNVAALENALCEVVRRHEALRTTFVNVDGEPMQVIGPAPDLRLRVEDVAAAAVEGIAQEEARKPFDLGQGVLRVRLLRTATDEHILLLVLHHIAGDRWSAGILASELEQLYAGVSLPELPIQYADYAAWQRKWLKGEVLAEQVAYWKEKLAGAPAVLDLPTDHARPAVLRHGGAIEARKFSPELVRGLEALSRQRGVTLFMTLLAGFQVLLSRYSGQEDIVTGSPIAGRTHAEIELLIGFFVNTLALRTDLSGNPSFVELLERVRDTALNAYAHADVPFEKLVEELKPERSLSYPPIFQVLFALQNAPQQALQLEGLTLERLPLHQGTSAVDQSWFAVETADSGLQLRVEYDTDLYDAATIRRMLEHYEVLLRGAMADPSAHVRTLPLLDAAERDQILYEWNATAVEYPREACVHELFEDQVKRTPDCIAALADGQAVTFAELNRRANQAAHELIAQGVRPGDLAGIRMTRGIDMLAGLLGILKAGAGYVPLDPHFPEERIAWISQNANARVVLTDDHLASFAARPEDNPCVEVPAANRAYVLHTSGSTGRPKGVEITHRNLVNLLLSIQREPGFTEADTLLAVTTISFDIATLEMFLPLISGGRVVIAPREAALDTNFLISLFEEHRPTVLQGTPATWRMLVEAGWKGAPNLKVFCGGEALSVELAAQLLPRCRELWNMYGPTETTIYSSVHHVRSVPERVTSIGHPVANTTLYVLDAQLQPVPVGVTGELYVGGDGVGLGYLNRPDLTAERFSPDPFVPGARMYRTGDLARFTANGEVDYLGRADLQVKVRGFRIELGEIETVLSQHPGVREAVVAVRDERLVAYIIGSAQPEELDALLRQKLPDYMIPAAFLTLDRFPLTANGKVDRKALPAPDYSEAREEYTAPRTGVEQQLAAIWSEVLRVDRIGIKDNFFALGGHSLLTMQVISRVRSRMGCDLPVRAVFECATLEALAARIEQAGRADQPQAITKVRRDAALPLSPAQERLWFLAQLEPDNAQYNVPMSTRLRGRLDIDALRRAIDGVIARHEILRTTYRVVNERPVQVIAAQLTVDLPLVTLPGLKAAIDFVACEGRKPFDLSTGPLIRAKLIRLAEDDHILLLTMHHSVTDGWSMRPLMDELTAIYQGAPVADLPIQYADYAAWQREWLGSEGFQKELDYWKGHLKGAPSRVSLPTDRPRPAVPTYRGATETVVFSKDLLAALHGVAQRSGATLYMMLLAGFELLLQRYSGQENVVAGTFVANRSQAEVENLIGMFVNTLPIHVTAAGNPTFSDFLAQVRTAMLEALSHQQVPFEELVRAIAPERDLSSNPLVQALIVLQEARRPAIDSAGVTFQPLSIYNNTAKFDVALFLTEKPEGLECTAEYATDLFDRSTVQRMLEHFRVLLEAAAAHPEWRIADLPLLDAAERKRILFEWNATATEYPQSACVHELFEAQAAHTPERTALVAADRGVTYAELNRMANQVAHDLIARGTRPGDLVGIRMTRGVEMLAGLLGIMKSGAAYVPLDPHFPEERIAWILKDADAQIVLTDEDRPRFAGRPEEDPKVHVPAEGRAYVLHTSGSTGKPKGVEITHRNVVNFLLSMQREPGLSERDVLLAVTTISFDIAGLELYLPLITGATVVIASREEAADGTSLLSLMRQYRPTVLQATPATWRMLIDAGWDGSPELKALCGGEALPGELAAQLLPRCGELWNMYGPTETTIWSSVHKVVAVPDGFASLGRPIANTTMYVLDAHRQPVPPGVAGELYIGGDGVALGYLNRPDLTAEKFVADPFGPGARMYRTGDLARWAPNGELYYLGRTDLQVKVRGFRIELGEIEAVLAQHPAVRDCVVALREERLVAYVIGSESADALRRWVREKLPEYMTPAAFVEMDRFPLTPNGKVDRKALPCPEWKREESIAIARTPIEEVVLSVWADVLKLDSVGLEDNFFELGGHSLSATQVVARLRTALQAEVSVRALFEAPTPRALAAAVERSKSGAVLPPITRADRAQALPLSFAQQRLWVIDQLEPESPLYNIPWAARLKGRLDGQALERALNRILARHEVLRTTYGVENDAPVQVIHDAPYLKLEVRAVAEAEAARVLQEEAAKPFRLATDIMFRPLLLKLGEEDHVLFINTHHIACDGWSLGLLASELAEYYSSGELPELTIQYADFAVWQRNWLKDDVLARQLAYWKEQLSGAPAVLSLPTDRPRSAKQTLRGAMERVPVERALEDQITATARKHGVTTFMTMLAAFEALLAHYTKQTDIVLGTDLAGRTVTETEALIGFFVNLVPVRTDLSQDPTFAELLGRVRDVTLGAYANQDVPFEKLVEELQPERQANRNPLVQVLFVHQNTPQARKALPEIEASVFPMVPASKFDLAVFYGYSGGGLGGSWVYNPDLFEAKTILNLADDFGTVLKAVTAHPDMRLSEIFGLLSTKQEQQLAEASRQKLKGLRRR